MTGAPGNVAISPPGSDEYAGYYETYVGKVGRDVLILDLLETQRIEVAEMLAGINDQRAGFRYASDKWSIKEVIGHMIDTERIFAHRGLCFARGEKQPLPGMDQDEYVAEGSFDDRNITDLALEYQTVRRSSIAQFSGFSPRQLERRGIASDCEFTCRATLFIIAGHERHHLGVLANLYGL
jgi:uncharacterized damage-inducible protein DinB